MINFKQGYAVGIFILVNSCCYSQNFKIETNCGFEVTIPSSFKKSKSIEYFSNTNCFDTILTNNKGCSVQIYGISYPENSLDTNKITAVKMLRGYELGLRKIKVIQSKIIYINNIEVGVLTYYPKGEVKNKKIFQKVFFVPTGKVRCIFDFIMNSDQYSSGISMKIIKTIKLLHY